MNLDNVRDQFEEEAAEYDATIGNFIPLYAEQNALFFQLMPWDASAPIRALDLGAGTGVLAHGILERYPNAHLTILDLAPNMISVARARLEQYTNRTEYREGDFSAVDIGCGYDLVMAGLSIHHLDTSAKEKLFHTVFRSLQPGGMFLIRDMILGDTPDLDSRYLRFWRTYLREHTQNDKEVYQQFLLVDRPSTIGDQLQWMKDAGFINIGCHWRYLNFAIYGGTKPQTGETQ